MTGNYGSIRKVKSFIIPHPASESVGTHLKNLFQTPAYQQKLFIRTTENSIVNICYAFMMNPQISAILSTASLTGMGMCTGLNIYCLLYTADAADEEDSVDLGGRRI